MAVGKLDPFKGMIWDNAPRTNEQIEKDLQIARLLMSSGQNDQPIEHWTQGAAQVLGTIGGALKERSANAAQAENDAYTAAQMDTWKANPVAAALAGPSPAAGATGGAMPTGYANPLKNPNMDPVAEVIAGFPKGEPTGETWLKYANDSATRNLPVNEKLAGALSFLPEMGIQMEVFSGGQPEKGSGLARVGSTRHDHGNAADVHFYKDGRKLDWSNPDDVPIYQDIVRKAKARGVTGFGAGPGYMAPGSMHVGFGAPSVWGANGSSANAPDWLRAAYAEEVAQQAQPNAPAQAPMPSFDQAMAGTRQPQTAAEAIETIAPINGRDPLAEGVRNYSPQSEAGKKIVQALATSQPSAGYQPQYNPDALLKTITDPRVNGETKGVAMELYKGEMRRMQQAQEEQQRRADPAYQMELEKRQIELNNLRNPGPSYDFQNTSDGKIVRIDKRTGTVQPVYEGGPKTPAPTDDMREYDFAKGQGYKGTFTEWQQEMKRAGATSVNLGGGSDKQVFEAVGESAKSARAAANGIRSIHEARKAINGGAVFGAAADTALGLRKIGALIGVGDPNMITNTETFRAAIAPQVAAMLQSTVGTANISNSDREFAEKAAGGSINLDQGTVSRLLNIMERAQTGVLQSHADRLNKVYPDGPEFARERALFSVDAPPPLPGQPRPISSPEEYNAMPSGTEFVAPDGTLRRKP